MHTLDHFFYVEVLSGIGIRRLFQNENWRIGWNNVTIKSGLPIAAIICSLATMMISLPACHFLNRDDSVPSPTDVENAGNNLAEQTSEGDDVFTTYPVLVLEADRQLPANLSRKMRKLWRQPNSSAADEIRREVLAEMHSGADSYVVMSKRTKRIIKNNPRINRTVERHYCPVSNGSRYWTDD